MNLSLLSLLNGDGNYLGCQTGLKQNMPVVSVEWLAILVSGCEGDVPSQAHFPSARSAPGLGTQRQGELGQPSVPDICYRNGLVKLGCVSSNILVELTLEKHTLNIAATGSLIKGKGLPSSPVAR